MNPGNQPKTSTKQRQPINPQQLRTTGLIFLVVGVALAILFVGLSITQNNWRFLLFASAPIAVEVIMGIVYFSIGTRNSRRTPA